ncbi:hypothetical protein [Salipiger abyssi]|uniref:Uncharacterized protein n=1 Tax=Salipiger abyssi TaxID=1250539 RepID=A0A1P8UXL4_9RHOB|nr:hypothetical protein [Salipiger abyssi]ALF02124.1 hypothetical protein vBPeaSP1_033 [Pelagibaca phage vB_PeaS-P1]APZ54139.1 hypothetical protein Ga0080574_TMP3805 [Salipiger abyssi]
MQLRDDQTISQRVAILEEALAKVLDRDGTMAVEQFDKPGILAVLVPEIGSYDTRRAHMLSDIARELEVLLS